MPILDSFEEILRAALLLSPNERAMLADQLLTSLDAFDKGLADRLLYIGSLLRLAAEEARNARIRLLILCSILELLVAHNPDYNRFNVEESIGKQFRLKVALLTYLNNRSLSLEKLGRQLRVIYEQRSMLLMGTSSN
jgi:hypothetical protein